MWPPWRCSLVFLVVLRLHGDPTEVHRISPLYSHQAHSQTLTTSQRLQRIQYQAPIKQRGERGSRSHCNSVDKILTISSILYMKQSILENVMNELSRFEFILNLLFCTLIKLTLKL